jgi:hypothetical protein
MKWSKMLLALVTPITMVSAVQAQKVQVLSATVKDKRIEGAEVLLQKNGAQTVRGTTNAQGNVQLSSGFADNEESMIIIKKPGYSTLVAKCPCEGMTYALSPVMENLDGMRIVLSWGKDPMDLDSHLGFPGNHIYWDSKTGTSANLDVDDIDSYGPETITIVKRKTGNNYVYTVHDYTDRENPGTNRLAQSRARVFVYIGQSLVRTYNVPQNMSGNLWTVFQITPDGELQDINRMGGTTLDPQSFTMDVLKNNSGRVYTPNYNLSSAQQLNSRGEDAYHSGNIAGAIDFYQSAINEDPNYSQAYSNLGLAYKKAGNKAEALWANRKAIALASGSNAATVRAGSSYNIGRIYEESNEFAEALRYYEQAQQEKENTVYTNAINRVSPKVR